MIISSSVLCYAVFQSGKQIKVFHVGGGKSEVLFNSAKEYADKMHKSGYPCQVEEFGFSGVGVNCYDSNN